MSTEKNLSEALEPVAVDNSSRLIMDLARRVAATDCSVLIVGESGTGKEVLARLIHRASPRVGKPFIAINCAAIPENMLEAMLFGYEKGSFTGAHAAHAGKFEQAQGGTLLLDEITEMPLALQAKLLRVLQEREVEPLGSERTEQVDVRVIAATNRDLRQLVSEGRFQHDLFYRLNVVPIVVPPLRERVDDIPMLVEYFVNKHAARNDRAINAVENGVVSRLQEYPWPGNVRELENTIERAVVLTTGPVIRGDSVTVEAAAPTPTSIPSLRLRQNIEWIECETIRRALEVSPAKRDAARTMGISPRALSHYLAKYPSIRFGRQHHARMTDTMDPAVAASNP